MRSTLETSRAHWLCVLLRRHVRRLLLDNLLRRNTDIQCDDVLRFGLGCGWVLLLLVLELLLQMCVLKQLFCRDRRRRLGQVRERRSIRRITGGITPTRPANGTGSKMRTRLGSADTDHSADC